MGLVISVLLFTLKAALTVGLGFGISFATKLNTYVAMGVAAFLADLIMFILVFEDEDEEPTV